MRNLPKERYAVLENVMLASRELPAPKAAMVLPVAFVAIATFWTALGALVAMPLGGAAAYHDMARLCLSSICGFAVSGLALAMMLDFEGLALRES